MKKRHSLTRREFIQRSAAGLATISSMGIISACSESQAELQMPKRRLGKTGEHVSILSFGGGSQFLKNKDGEWERILERGFELGINFYDTSSSYGSGSPKTSEERFGEILAKHRKKILISTKFDSRNPRDAMAEFDRSLKRMKTDYVDVLLIHSIEPSDDLVQIENGVYRQLIKLKEEKMVRFIGFSSMNSAQKSKELIEKLDFDVCLLAMNPTQYGDFAKIALPSALARNVGVLAMKVMRNIIGKEATAKELLEYAWNQSGVATALVGHYKMETLEENARIAHEFSLVEKSAVDYNDLEQRLAHLASPHSLSWARPDYQDGMMG